MQNFPITQQAPQKSVDITNLLADIASTRTIPNSSYKEDKTNTSQTLSATTFPCLLCLSETS